MPKYFHIYDGFVCSKNLLFCQKSGFLSLKLTLLDTKYVLVLFHLLKTYVVLNNNYFQPMNSGLGSLYMALASVTYKNKIGSVL
jgi:hypothetical protein